ncbi:MULTISPECIES: hypothetical protein [Aquimarina]|uniref:hypothetical protein n=1 Tax=Aquimarina TaxID=290174 RepID=UPI000CDF086B|nr:MULTISPECIES: hypothetical protein [Aquimarina]
MSRKYKKIERLKKSDLFPEEFLKIYEKDYDELVKEKDEEIGIIKKKLSSSNVNISDLFDSLTFDQKNYLYIHLTY